MANQTVLSLDKVLERDPTYLERLQAGIAAGRSWAPEQLNTLRALRGKVQELRFFADAHPHPEVASLVTTMQAIVGNVESFGGILHPSLGELARAVVMTEDGKPLWDQYAIWEMPGAITVPYHTEEGYHIGMIEVARPIVGPVNFHSRAAFREWLDNPDKRGYTMSWEVPRGFGLKGEKPRETALREFRQELGSRTRGLVLDVEELGETNPNTAFYSNRGIDTLAVLVDPARVEEIGVAPDVNEKIAKATYLPFAEVRDLVTNGTVFCGLSKAALGAFMMKHLESIVESMGYRR
ncbi:NUDIX domain-containing protein [Candidatus Woesearchaeota archaeon]|nr:NUDIX domain-containing protein [Candidatus Woesearchaeota archaeon]